MLWFLCFIAVGFLLLGARHAETRELPATLAQAHLMICSIERAVSGGAVITEQLKQQFIHELDVCVAVIMEESQCEAADPAIAKVNRIRSLLGR